MTIRTLSAHNARVVRLGKLSARRRVRDTERAFVVDGPTLLAEALTAGVEVTEVYVDTDRLDEQLVAVIDRAEAANAQVFGVDAEVLRRVTDPVAPRAIAGVAHRGDPDPNGVTGARSVLGLVGVADPGNAGTLVRGAVAAGFESVFVTPGTVELFGPKAVRASAGALFHLDVVEFDSERAAFAACRDAGLTTVATTLDADVDYDRSDLSGPCAVLVGNEAHGLDPELAALADIRVRIPMVGPAESLNAAMAGTLVCFEVLRQRRVALEEVATR